jgi:hypothetical protein
MPSESPDRPRIFLSYRRRDTAGETGRLYDQLVARRPYWETFLDVDFIRPGRDFLREIDRFLSSCQLVVAAVGERWLTADGPDKARRIDNPADVVRLELERAHALHVPILPVVMSGAVMPKTTDLPAELSWFSRINAQRLRHESFENDLTELLVAMDSLVIPDEAGRSVDLVTKTRRSRTLRIQLRSESHLVHFETRHSGSHRLTVDGIQTGRKLRDFGSRLTLNKQYSIDLSDGPRTVTAIIDVRYLSDLLWLIGTRVTLDGRTSYSEGSLLY